MIENIGLGIAVFVLAVVLDELWARMTMASANRQVHRAGRFAALTVFVGGINIVGYTEHHWLLFPIAAGAYIGTAHAVHGERKKDADPVAD